MNPRTSRRRFLQNSAWMGGLAWAIGPAGLARGGANGKLNIGMIGVANQGQFNLSNVAGENIVALCDVDDRFLAEAGSKFPAAKRYTDFRRLLDQRDVEAVVVAVPDHSHAVATVWALEGGRHVYCEKPLTRTVSEARIVTRKAREAKRATQLGTQIHAGTNYRRVVEWVQSGALGPVHDVHVWVAASYGGADRPQDCPPIPGGIHYDSWIGPVPFRPYSAEYLPFKWRNWWAFGGGALADFGCHFMDLPFWALGLQHPQEIEVVDGPPVHPDSPPPWLVVRYRFPARGAAPPVTLTWYHGGRRPDQLPEDPDYTWKSGVWFIGERGSLVSDYTRHRLHPRERFEGFAPPARSIPDSVGHHQEWIQGCKTGSPTTCDFDYAGLLTEAALLGNAAFRSGTRIEWQPELLEARHQPGVQDYLRHFYRPGWAI